MRIPFISKNESFTEKWANVIVNQADYLNRVSKSTFQFGHDRENEKNAELKKIFKQSANENKSSIEIHDYLQINLEAVKDHLLNNGYIKEPIWNAENWELTEKGILMKELGSHNKYQKYRAWQINSFKRQNIINVYLIAATILAAVVPWIIAKYYPPIVNVNAPAQSDHQGIHIDSVLLRQVVVDEMRNIKANPILIESSKKKPTKKTSKQNNPSNP